MNFLLKEIQVRDGVTPGLEFVVPTIKQQPQDILSSTHNSWDNYQKREKIEEHMVDFRAIMHGMHRDGFIRQAVSKYVNSIFLRGYKIHSLKPAIEKHLQIRLQLIVDAMPDHNHIDDFFQSMAKDLVAYANVYVIKQRRAQKTLPRGLKIQGIPSIKAKGKPTDKPILEKRDPIVAYELVHPAAMHIIRDKNGNVIRFEQWPMGEHKRPADKKKIKEWDPEEVIHISIDREDGYAYGTPFLTSVVDDIRMLRNLEDHVSRLAFRFAFPFTQVKVGEAKPGMQATEEDLVYYRNLVANAPADATLTTSEKVSFNVVGAQGEAIDLKPYLEHFKGRSYTGLGVSPVSMGEGSGASRSTADAMSTEMHDQIKHFQNVLARNINNEILRELLLEGGFDLYADIDKNWAKIIFEEIEVEAQIKRESHALALLQANAITFDEFRVLIGRQPFTAGNWDDTYLIKFVLPQDAMKTTGKLDLDEHGALIQQQHDLTMQQGADAHAHSQMDMKLKKKELDTPVEPGATAPGAHVTTTTGHAITTGGGKRTVKKTTVVKKPVAAPAGHIPNVAPGPAPAAKTTAKGTGNKNRPANQHGKRTGPKRSTEAAKQLEALTSRGVDVVTRVSRFREELYEIFTQLRIESIEQAENYRTTGQTEEPALAAALFAMTKSRLESMSRRYLTPAFVNGIGTFVKDAKLENGIVDPWTSEHAALTEFNAETFQRLIGDICRPTLRIIKKATATTDFHEAISAVFDAVEYRLDLIANTEIPQAFWFGYASAAHLTSHELELVREEGACEECAGASNVFVNSSSARKRLTLSPTLHPGCGCGLSPKMEAEVQV